VIVTDLNDRERRKFAEQFDKAADAFKDFATALRDGNDDKAVVHLVVASLVGHSVGELLDIFEKAVVASAPDYPPTKQPGGGAS
jgi:hypothetical protein